MTHRFVESALAYARDVVAGNIVAGKLERLVCQRQLDDLERAAGDDWPWEFDIERAERPCYFLELLPHIKGKWARGQGLIVLEPWQCFLVTTVFGWVHKDTRCRRYRVAYIEVARKNAKSTLSSGLALYMLSADGEHGADIYSAATTRDQARIVFDDAREMAKRSPDMRDQLGVAILAHSITVAQSASKMQALAAEGNNLDGLNVHFCVIDELHAHKTRKVYDVIDTARGAREQSLLWVITTAGSDRAGICYERRTHAVKVLQGLFDDPTTFAAIYTIDEDDDPFDPAVWRKSNPNLGVSVLEDDMQAAARQAQSMPSSMANFLTKRLNVWVSSFHAWMDMQAWRRCANPALTVEQVAHLPCIVGLDLASKVDVNASQRLFYDKDADHYYLISRFYLPEAAIAKGNSQYDGWGRAGYMHYTDGEVVDMDLIEEHLRNDVRDLDILEVPYDPFQATQMAGHLLSEGLPMIEYRQTVLSMSEAMKTLESLVLQGKITHDGNPAMDWMISNVICKLDAKDNIYPRKERVEQKIDGPVATIMALGRWIAQKPAEKSWWEIEGQAILDGAEKT